MDKDGEDKADQELLMRQNPQRQLTDPREGGERGEAGFLQCLQ